MSLPCRYDEYGDGIDIELKNKSNKDLSDDGYMEFEDVFTLTSYSLIITNIKKDQFELHRLVQFSARKWLELNNELEKWTEIYIRIVSEAFLGGDYKSWTICQVLFPHAKTVLAYRLRRRSI